MTKTLYLMLGYPGAGKTTAARAIAEATGAVHLWADHERRLRFKVPTYSHQENIELYNDLNRHTEKLLREGKSVVFDTNFNFIKDREKLRKVAAKCGAETKLMWVTVDKAVAKQRATENAHLQDSRVLGDMPASEFERMSKNLQPPAKDEPHIELDGTKISKDYITQKLKLS